MKHAWLGVTSSRPGTGMVRCQKHEKLCSECSVVGSPKYRWTIVSSSSAITSEHGQGRDQDEGRDGIRMEAGREWGAGLGRTRNNVNAPEARKLRDFKLGNRHDAADNQDSSGIGPCSTVPTTLV